MKNELDSKMVLAVFEKIRQHGETVEVDFGNAYMLDGVKAFTDHDGYTLFLEDATVQLRFGFHNQYHFEYDKAEQLEQFEKKLAHIHKAY